MLFTIGPDGTGINRITRGPRWRNDSLPTYSPDGHQIVFVRSLNVQSANDLWIVNANGTHPHDVTNTPSINEYAPDWGPPAFIGRGPWAQPGE